ncbi:hypothetical protein BRARA_A03480 [Brassica rapa]|uniref:NAC domain-containing protein n=1 Tax=Brassica campestris TaxID=3711 RepID=A0A398AZC1_BRACM|nr:hypothetical protein BRARA_A03480 [Brassica rapa]
MAVVESSPPSATAPGAAVSATSLAPGFRFHPTDEELVSYYLKRKVLGKPVRIFHKNNIGPPSGNRYAPFMEEEWSDDRVALIPGVDVRVRAEPLPLANGNNQMNQEIQPESKDLININEPPRETTTQMDIELNHQENNNNNRNDEVEEALKREETEEDERLPPPPPPVCVLNKEAPLPLLQYKRRRQNESTRTTQDHSSSTTTTVDNTPTLVSNSTAAAATNTAISALLEFSLMGISDKKENPKEASPPPAPLPSPEEKLNDLKKEVHQMSVERETFKLEMMSAEAMISILQSRIDALRQENDELKKNSANGH